MDVRLEMPGDETREVSVKYGEITRVSIPEKMSVEATITPYKSFDVGEGRGKKLETTIEGGVEGLLLDARGRPLIMPEAGAHKALLRWFRELELYPAPVIEALEEM
jgi:hypothetical protein